jgi:hypothetical protein
MHRRASRRKVPDGPPRAPEGCGMLDVVMLAIGLGFFALSVGYTIACDQL